MLPEAITDPSELLSNGCTGSAGVTVARWVRSADSALPMARQYGYPRLTEGAKRKILGLNSARLYKLAASGNISEHGQGHGKGLYKPFPGDYVERIPASLKTLLEFPGFTADNFARARMAYHDWKGAAPRHTRFGWIRNQA